METKTRERLIYRFPGKAKQKKYCGSGCNEKNNRVGRSVPTFFFFTFLLPV